MYYLFADKIGFFVSDEYYEKWGSEGFSVLAETVNKEQFDAAETKLSIFKSTVPSTDGLSEDSGYYFSDTVFYDKKLGAMVVKNSDHDFSLFASQDCPEWVTLMTEIMLLKSDLTIVHAAALEKDGNALFLPAKGGVGKTATVVKMVREHGWRLLGDDLIVLDGNSSKVYPYLKHFVIYGYHRNLFPELFKGIGGPVRSDTISHLMTKMIPFAKKILRLMPGMLHFAREHNPQQMRVLPKDIFNPEQLSIGANHIDKTIWLERTAENAVSCVEVAPEEIASRCASVTLTELTYGNMNLNLCLFIMCANGILDYNEIYPNIYHIVLGNLKNIETKVLSIPQKLSVETVPEYVLKNL